MIKRKGYIIWPIYFDRSVPRSRCRRVPLSLAVRRPDAKMLAEAARRLGWRVEVEEGSHPAMWWRRSGRIVVQPGQRVSKERVIRMIAEQLKRMER